MEPRRRFTFGTGGEASPDIPIIPDYVPDNLIQSTSEKLAREILDKTSQKTELEDSISVETERLKDLGQTILAVRAEYEKKMNILQQEKTDLDSKVWTTQRKIREITREIIDLEKQLQLELAKERATAEFLSNADKFDKLTAGLAWREWAFDYQIDGGKVLANNKKAILGDKRGL